MVRPTAREGAERRTTVPAAAQTSEVLHLLTCSEQERVRLAARAGERNTVRRVETAGYCERSARTGSTRVAARAGNALANAVTAAKKEMAAA